MKYCFGWILVGFVFFGSIVESYATHIRAGEITVERIQCGSSNRTFRITITGWVDLESTVEFGGGELNFGDGSPVITLRESANLILEQDLGNNVGIVQFQVQHTFAAGGVFVLSYLEANRNAGILNMNNSVETTFYIETLINIDSFLGCSNSPKLLIPPIDEGCVGATFFHNPGAYDEDGDSISYELTIPKRDRGSNVNNYRDPNHPEFGGTTEDGAIPTTFSIDATNGDVIWDAPGTEGEYNIAFEIREWRKKGDEAFLMSIIVRDMQIIIQECDNDRPELEIPPDLCVEAGTEIDVLVLGFDPDNDPVQLEAYGGTFEVETSPSTFDPDPPRFDPQPARGTFNWQTNCFHVREQPYQVTYKITDDPEDGPNLVGFEPWNVTVVAPAPTGLGVTINADRTNDLVWDSYICSNADKIQIWRRVDSFDIDFEECVTGIPDSAGYELVEELGVEATSYKDDNTGSFLDPELNSPLLDFGARYCYRLVVVFPQPAGGESYVSEEACGIIRADAPIITNVTVDKTNINSPINRTNATDGEITVKWRKPFEIDETLFPPPYQYDVYRSVGYKLIGDYELVAENLAENDTVFKDTGLNTADEAYKYRIQLKDANGVEIIRGAPASSVFVNPKSLFQKIEVSWDQFNVPWSNRLQDFPMHYIFRDRISADGMELVLIDSVNVNSDGFVYLDDGSFNGEELDETLLYCYFVITRGSYGNPKIQRPLINFSQIACAQPNDTIPPTSPILTIELGDCEEFLSEQPCSFNEFSNFLTWERVEDQLDYYNLYFSSTGEEPFELIGPEIPPSQLEFVHTDLPSFKGCYYITAVDRSGNESDPSELACNDNCPNYVLPNIFTPNGDTFNELYNAFNDIDDPELDQSLCPRFVDKVTFTVINRNGKEVYTYVSGGENSILIGWDGKTNDGELLPAGTYYYSAEVEYDVLDPDLKKEVIKGWLDIAR
jgi:hypothetical protein